jgi:hypothetical protein
MARCEFRHDDPAPLARAASIRSAREQDARTRERARTQTMAERLLEGFRLARFSDRLRDAAR